MKILIITGGRIDEDFAFSFLEREYFEHIIVVDGALAFWDKVENNIRININFDHLVGDFDTISPDILEKYLKRGDIEIHRFNPEKDYTDTDIALKLAIRLGEQKIKKNGSEEDVEITLLGATGTRADHMLANLQLLEQTRAAGMTGIIVDRNNRIRLIEERFILKKAEQFGHYVSLIPVSEELKAVTLKGFKYPLDRYTVHLGESICVSNELEADEGEIVIEEGKAFFIESRD
ncbi:MAG: thiamine diphosphokinase [Coprococcus sp.]